MLALKSKLIVLYRVTLLKCHKNRVKRIATENSPSLFLTVSEDGTVRQHDLRRPHSCSSECPEALFQAPRGVDLYSLSVSTVTPHIFAVAGTSPYVNRFYFISLVNTYHAARRIYVIAECSPAKLPPGVRTLNPPGTFTVCASSVSLMKNGRPYHREADDGYLMGKDMSAV